MAPVMGAVTIPRRNNPEQLSDQLIKVQIGGEVYDKPLDPSCACCISPWMLQIDHWLAAGYSFTTIRERLRARRARQPTEASLRGHIAHLAPPHQADREALDHAEGAPSVSLEDATARLIARAYEKLVAGDEVMQLQARDLIRAIKLASDLEERRKAGEHATADEYQQAFTEFFELARLHMGPEFGLFMRDVYASEAISRMTGRPAPPALLQATAQGPEPITAPAPPPPDDDEVASTR